MTYYAIRLLSTDGLYPSEPLVIEDFALLVAEDNLVWSAVDCPPLAHEPVGELSWLSPDEIRFYSAVSLALSDPGPRFRINTRSEGREISIQKDCIDRECLIATTWERAHEFLQELSEEGLLVPQRRSKPILLDIDPEDQVLELLYAMDAEDPLLIRGLYKLLMADELIRFRQFLEEAALASYVSREAALELLRRKLESERDEPVTRKDVFQRIRVAFPTGNAFVELLESDWEARIMMVHPSSRFGEFWNPPIFAQECYDAHHTLVHLYRYLLLGEVWEPELNELTLGI